MEEIKFGEYCRTKKGIIFQAKDNITINENIPKKYKKLVDDVVKHSKNIIDLIEVGDIVNKGYIYEIGNAENGDRWIHNLNGLLLYNEDIKTILTKEQIENNCYRIGE